MPDLAAACKRRPFANGTEGEAWMACWCDVCTHDHSAHTGEYDPAGCCDVIGVSMLPEFPSDEFPWPEAWLPQPDDGRFSLPSRLVCGMFEPCTKGACCGDPGADERPGRVEATTAYWASR
jgi:hypothetical protein